MVFQCRAPDLQFLCYFWMTLFVVRFRHRVCKVKVRAKVIYFEPLMFEAKTGLVSSVFYVSMAYFAYCILHLLFSYFLLLIAYA